VNYRTTCPHCKSIFLLGEDQLGAAQGWVQCSVCGAAFDAYPGLLLADGSPLPIVEPEPAEAPPQPELAPSTEPEMLEDIPAAATAVASGEETPPAVPGSEDITPRGIAQRETSADLPSIILIDPDLPYPDDIESLPQIEMAPADAPEPAAKPTAPTAAAAFTPMPAARIEYATPQPGKVRVASAPRRLKPWVWVAASGLLLLLLLVQSSYFLRDTLASRLPQTRPALEQVCTLLGCTLSLPKNLALLQIIGSDLQTEASGRLKLTLTLGNRAGHAQAWPMLVLTLTDQRNRPLARRSFAPSEYLGDAKRIATGIPPRSEQVLDLPLTVRDLTPMGFDLKISY
jgi:predicted Zn finger-like uncharacterized protein